MDPDPAPVEFPGIEDLTPLVALGVIRFERDDQSKRSAFPSDDLTIRPFGDPTEDTIAPAKVGSRVSLSTVRKPNEPDGI